MKDSLDNTKEFHRTFGQGVPVGPCISENDDKIHLYEDLLTEEFTEFQDAIEASNEVETLDALCDMQVILDGLWIQTGMHGMKDKAMNEVHRSNMSKAGKDGKPIYREDGKIMKGPDFFKPDLETVLKNFKTHLKP